MNSHRQSVWCDQSICFIYMLHARSLAETWVWWPVLIYQSTPCTCCVAGRTSTERWLYSHKQQQQQQNVQYKWSPLLIPLQTVVWCIYHVTETAVWRTETVVWCFYSHEQQRTISLVWLSTLRKCAFAVCACMYCLRREYLVGWLAHTHTHTPVGKQKEYNGDHSHTIQPGRFMGTLDTH